MDNETKSNATSDSDNDNELDSFSDCDHPEMDNNNYCTICGIYAIPLIENKSEMIIPNTKRIVIKTLSPNISKLPIPGDIINEANRILAELSRKGKKLKRKTKLDFYCLYKAYQNLKISKDTNNLGKMLGLHIKDINSALLLYSEFEDDNNGVYRELSASDLIEEYCNKIGCDQRGIQQVAEITRISLEKNPSLNDENPRKLISGVIKYYMTINGIDYNKTTFKQELGFSDATLGILAKKIGNIYTG
jgi:hypothetical protein